MYTVPNATFIKSPIRIQCRIIAGSIKLIVSKLMLKKSWYDILSFRNICLTLQLSPYPDRVEVGIFMGRRFLTLIFKDTNFATSNPTEDHATITLALVRLL